MLVKALEGQERRGDVEEKRQVSGMASWTSVL